MTIPGQIPSKNAHLRTSDFDYSLPQELIAQTPLPQRDQSRMMVLQRASQTIIHSRFCELPQWLQTSDLLVLNDTKVIPGRFLAVRARAGARGRVSHSRIEVLLLEEASPALWEALVRPGQKVHKGDRILFGGGEFEAVVVGNTDFHGRLLQFESAEAVTALLEKHGAPPLPPYIKRARQTEITRTCDADSYQTIYARSPGAVAAPTAGFHFTEQTFQKLQQSGVGIAYLTLHIGLGTFRPVRVEEIERHVMHRERFTVPAETLRAISETKAHGNRVVAVGTTVVRTLEAIAREQRSEEPRAKGGEQRLKGEGITGATDIFIYPPFEFKTVDALLTNFHLPRSTLLMMVCAFAAPARTDGRDLVLRAYAEAIKEKYRFYSYGDCMLIL